MKTFKSAVDLVAALHMQLGFLSRSCKLYDQGHIDEAIRIAVVLRILFHDGKDSSLLTNLNARQTQISTSLELVDKFNLLGISELICHCDNSNSSNPKMTCHVEPMGPKQIIPNLWINSEQWWNQAIYVFLDGIQYTRRDIALHAANKAGGAHVDKTLPQLYARLSSTHAGHSTRTQVEGVTHFSVGIGLQSTLDNPGTPIKNFQLSDLRQMGYELMASPNLLKLANF